MCCSTSKAVIIPNLEMSISLLLERCLVTDSYGFYLRERVLLSDKAFGKYNLLMRLFFFTTRALFFSVTDYISCNDSCILRPFDDLFLHFFIKHPLQAKCCGHFRRAVGKRA